ncbi:MAG: energy-coupling factor ABC transporter ATP-binding protein [Actinomycetaceae bacterium]|nr:energy-coupling factor ABC transporter ATP-binding protein [Actinomycetaceae bacterium]
MAVTIENFSFAYEGSRPNIHGINLYVPSGQCHVLMGASGSGKTTIIRCVNGLAGGYYAGKTTGELYINEADTHTLEAWERAQKVGSVFQDPASQFFSAQLPGEIAFGCENLGYEHDKVRERTDAMISRMGLNYLSASDIDTLSSGEKQKVAIASALAPEPTILAMDEPSENLDTHAAYELGNTLLSLKNEGYTLIIAEHRIAYLMNVADYFHYVEGGTIVRTLTRDEVYRLSESERTQMGIRSPFAITRSVSATQSLLSRHCEPRSGEAISKGDVGIGDCFVSPDGLPRNDGVGDDTQRLEVHDLTVRIEKKDIVTNVNLSLEAGAITAITGENGAGKTTLMRAIAGLIKTSSGNISLGGRVLNAKERRRKIWYSPNDLSAQFFTASVGEEIMLQKEPTEENIERARTLLKNFGLYEYKNQHPYALSGGQKQRLALACGLMQDRPVLILDEPTSGLDSINMQRLAHALRIAAQEGTVIAVVTHDNEFIRACATDIYEVPSSRTPHERITV